MSCAPVCVLVEASWLKAWPAHVIPIRWPSLRRVCRKRFTGTVVILIVFYFLIMLVNGVLRFPMPHIEQRPVMTWGVCFSTTLQDDVEDYMELSSYYFCGHMDLRPPGYSLKRWFRDASPRLQIMVTGLIAPKLVHIDRTGWLLNLQTVSFILRSPLELFEDQVSLDNKEWTTSHGFFAPTVYRSSLVRCCI